jgi:hypothetical protein
MIQFDVQQDLGRAKNALQDYLIRKLLIPKVYLDANWNGIPVHVLAIDRAGVGDVHAVLINDRSQDDRLEDANKIIIGTSGMELGSVEEFRLFPSHYRYIAIINDKPNIKEYELSLGILQKSLADDGVGRIGILYVDLSKEVPAVQVLLKPERFRSSKEIIELADRFVAENTPNWEVRE